MNLQLCAGLEEFRNLGEITYFGSSSVALDLQGYKMAFTKTLKYDSANVWAGSTARYSFGLSVRCIKD